MSLKDFQTILVPSNKTGALQFYHKPTKAILEAAFSRPDIGATSGATVFRDGQLIELGENDPDWDDANGCPRLLMRPQKTAILSNNTMQGAIVGVVGSGGSFPTGWLTNNRGLTPEIISIGSQLGVDYIDIKYSGTATATTTILLLVGGTSTASSSNGETWNFSSYIQKIDETTPPEDYNLSFGLRFSAGYGQSNYPFNPTGDLIRYEQTHTINQVGNISAEPIVAMSVISGNTYDFTIRVGLPQFEKEAQATAIIKTYGTVVTRSANQYTFDLTSYLSANIISFYVEVSFGVTQQDLFRFGDGGNANLVAFGIDNQKIKGRYRIDGGAYSSTGVGIETVPLNEIVKIAGVITPTGLKVSYGGAIDLNVSIDLSGLPLINTLKSGAIFDTLFPHEIKAIALTPLELTDDQLNVATA